ncbi:apurinic endonuclease apn1 : Probable endonuclease 4 OS=Planctomyces brasiliensis (strain ATCC 49424 / DSM 5305 / JCM 21570 / NBRC 103401 / IFAM 1448) GN=nfo PE=3 SV=1: AP_endonuc_2 [Gemmata massiliana]|uniref:Probable endonuclease 4 n=1 Tax=Gemmata massiliana TaxID=1210884 RepID=A0A6P2D2E2_9BACT|nr:deoxyribonuclease IV [Gemmata massiliana]VTR95498.1 apurinic endonuclease apn1 : Probable endonuclease 4 OS=Planctomyces brasiliensis (strain ATCC 49424 / DSM 5305 / JCM 21570 / NBRC 103401 / IFAM 1448) GN=nfo PE=3 SV=1: AP_endonuc_2 [Gemmata massiliana]
MPLFGAHLSISRGLHNAISAASSLGCDTVQIFTKNASKWAAESLSPETITQFRRAASASRLKHLTAHDSYLINLASPDAAVYAKSVETFVDELERAEALGLDYLVTHPGAHTGSGEDAGLARVIEGFEEVHARCAGFNVRVLIETTAGQGTSLGHRFEHIATILDRAKCADRMGVCLDTCHVFAAGYPLGSDSDYRSTFQQFDDLVGVDRLKLFHVNDSAKALGSRVDRHAGIGLGEIGPEAFRRLVTDPRFLDRPMILETPKKNDDGDEMDAVNLALLRKFAANGIARAG